MNTLHELVRDAGTRLPGAPAFLAPGRPLLDYRALYDRLALFAGAMFSSRDKAYEGKTTQAASDRDLSIRP